MINCTYPKIDGGVNAIIEEEGNILAHNKFEKLNDAVCWTNAFVEGYEKGLTESSSWESREERARRLSKRRIDLARLDAAHKITMDKINNKEWDKL